MTFSREIKFLDEVIDAYNMTTDIELRPKTTLGPPPPIHSEDDSFHFSPTPLFFPPSPPPSVASDDGTDMDDCEEVIQSSWHHRALLGDEYDRPRYVEERHVVTIRLSHEEDES